MAWGQNHLHKWVSACIITMDILTGVKKMGEYRALVKRAFLGATLVGFLCFQISGQTLKGMTTIGTYVRPGTIKASAGIWGWTGATGKEYALLTSREPGGVCIVDISNPTVPKEVNFIPSTGNSIWHEVTSYRNAVYKVSQENSDGLQIIDMAPLNQGKPAVLVRSPTTWFKTAHTVYVDSTVSPARLFVAYESTQGVKIFTLEDPFNPKLIRTIVGETHDMFGRGDRLYSSNQFKSTLTIWNIANVATVEPLKVAVIDFNATDVGIAEPAKSISHNAWPSDDNKTLFTTEETAGTTLKAWDITDISLTKPPKLIGKYIGIKGIITHNVYIVGKLMYVAHYTAGIRVVDISDPSKMVEVAFHRPSASKDLFGGTWGIYAWFKSGLVIHGDDVLGLQIEKLDAAITATHPKSVSNAFTIQAKSNGIIDLQFSKTGPYVLSIYTATGEQIVNYSGMAKSSTETISLGQRNYSSGNYFARLHQNAGSLSSPIRIGN